MRPTISIIVPTIGRPTLVDTLESINRQELIRGDQVLIVYDSHQPDRKNLEATREMVESFGFTFLAHDGGYHFQGNPQLNQGMASATGEYLSCLGDDDIYVDGAITRLRKKCAKGRVVLFQFSAPPDMVTNRPGVRLRLWATKTLQVANLSGCCVAAPRGAWTPVSAERRCEVDFDWIRQMVAKSGQRPVWMDDCLIIARPEVRNGVVLSKGVGTCPTCGFTGFLEDFTGRVCNECAPVVLESVA